VCQVAVGDLEGTHKQVKGLIHEKLMPITEDRIKYSSMYPVLRLCCQLHSVIAKEKIWYEGCQWQYDSFIVNMICNRQFAPCDRTTHEAVTVPARKKRFKLFRDCIQHIAI
jgi:hypothetical protein